MDQLNWKRLAACAGGVVGAFLLMAQAAVAHPHVWVAVRSEILFGADGKITGVRHSWSFDEMYSAFAVQGLTTQSEFDELARVNVKQLQESNYFTIVRASGRKPDIGNVRDATIVLDDKKNVTLKFTADFAEPASANKAFVLQVFDPDYFVAFEFEKDNPVTMANAPQGCSLRVFTPKPLNDDDMRRLQDSAGTNNSPGSDIGLKLATRVTVACP